MEKKPFLTEAMAQEIIQDVPTPFHVYDEKGIRENARRINKAFSWNKGFKEYFAVKALPNPVILQILKEEGCGVDCSSLTELMLSEVCGFSGSEIMFSSNQTPVEDMKKAYELPYYRSGAELGSHFTGVPGALSPAAPSLHRSTRILLFRIAFVGPYYMGFLPICQGACSLIPIPLWTNGT